MDDRELEARLRAHLHTTVDDAQPPRELASSVKQLLATQPRGLGLPGRRVRSPMRLGFSLTAAAAAVVLLAIAIANLGSRLGPASNGSSPSPSAAPSERTFVVLPPTAEVPSKPEASAASDVLTARLRALGVDNFTMSGGYGMTLTVLDLAGPSDDEVRAVLAAPGIVQFIPIPAGDPTVSVGQVLSSPALFGSDGVKRVADATDQNGQPALRLELTPTAAQLLANDTRRHVGGQLAIVIDGRVASAPIIQTAILDGSVQITNESSPQGVGLDPVIRAILIGGPLPSPWRQAPVVSVIPSGAAEAIAVREAGTPARVVSADAQALRLAGWRWIAVWNVVLAGDFPASCPSIVGPGETCGPTVGTELVVLDGPTGGFIQREAPAP